METSQGRHQLGMIAHRAFFGWTCEIKIYEEEHNFVWTKTGSGESEFEKVEGRGRGQPLPPPRWWKACSTFPARRDGLCLTSCSHPTWPLVKPSFPSCLRLSDKHSFLFVCIPEQPTLLRLYFRQSISLHLSQWVLSSQVFSFFLFLWFSSFFEGTNSPNK